MECLVTLVDQSVDGVIAERTFRSLSLAEGSRSLEGWLCKICLFPCPSSPVFPHLLFPERILSPVQLPMAAYYLPFHSLSNNRGKWQFSVASRRSGKIHFPTSLPFPINFHCGEKWLKQVLMLGQFCVLLYLNYVSTESGWKH